MSTIMAAAGESRWGRSCFQTAARTSGRLRGRGCALEVDVGPHIPEDLGGRDLKSSVQRLLPFLRAIHHPRAAHVPGYGPGWASAAVGGRR